VDPGQLLRDAGQVGVTAAAAGIQVRAGIHTGEVDLTGEDIAGISVQITDRVAALARAGTALARPGWWPGRDRASAAGLPNNTARYIPLCLDFTLRHFGRQS